ncbi:hypothetical protein AN958_04747 [Leucoagaricus sp. SymC.cos]|nr:hypothetical protein AN958_04747 [Leucoagaricus sp. SymC.cos]
MVFFLCLAQFLDTFMNPALFAATPPISQDLNISNANSVWLISGYQLTFAALLLIVYDLPPEIVFTVGATLIGGLSLGSGFVRHAVPLILILVLTRIESYVTKSLTRCTIQGAALMVPYALHLIIHMFPNPVSQSKAIAAFGAGAALGNVIGLIIGALIVSYASWPWVFYLFSILGFMLAIVVLILALSPHRPHVSALEKALRFKRLDLLGVSMLTWSVDKWSSATCLAPLIVSILLVAASVVYESLLDEHYVALYQNFPILAASALLPFMLWGTVQLLFSWLWQEVYGWSAIIAALHFLPLGLLGFPMNGLSSALLQKVPLKWVIIAGQVVGLAGTILLPFADSGAHYWRYVFPAFCLGTSGITIMFTVVDITIFTSTPPSSVGVVGAVFNCSLQLGCAAGTAIITSIQMSVQKTQGGPTNYSGRGAGFWFLFCLLALLTAAQLVFMKNGPKEKDVDGKDIPVSSRDGSAIEQA